MSEARYDVLRVHPDVIASRRRAKEIEAGLLMLGVRRSDAPWQWLVPAAWERVETERRAHKRGVGPNRPA